VTDVEDAPQFGVELLLVIELRILPVDWMSGRRFETSLSHGFLCSFRA